MNPVIEIMCEGEKVCLGAFAIRGRTGGLRGYRTTGITTRAVIRQQSPEKDRVERGLFIGGMGILNLDERKKAQEEKDANVEDFAKNTNCTEKQRPDALFADSESRERGNSATLTLEGTGLLSKGRRATCYGEWATEKMKKVLTNSASGYSADTEGIMKDTTVLHLDESRKRQPRHKIFKTRDFLVEHHGLGFGRAPK